MYPNLMYNSISNEMATKQVAMTKLCKCDVCKTDNVDTCLYAYSLYVSRWCGVAHFEYDERKLIERDIQACLQCTNKYKYNTKY
jgi:hypothetical protein